MALWRDRLGYLYDCVFAEMLSGTGLIDVAVFRESLPLRSILAIGMVVAPAAWFSVGAIRCAGTFQTPVFVTAVLMTGTGMVSLGALGPFRLGPEGMLATMGTE